MRLHTINMSGCSKVMVGCDLEIITDAAFVHLQGIHTLNMMGCNQITDAAFGHLGGI